MLKDFDKYEKFWQGRNNKELRNNRELLGHIYIMESPTEACPECGEINEAEGFINFKKTHHLCMSLCSCGSLLFGFCWPIKDKEKLEWFLSKFK